MSFAYHMGGLVWITTKQREITNLNIAIRLNAHSPMHYNCATNVECATTFTKSLYNTCRF